MTFNPIPAAQTHDSGGGGALSVARPRYIPTLTDVVNADDLRNLASGASDRHLVAEPEFAHQDTQCDQPLEPTMSSLEQGLRAQLADALMAQQGMLVQALLDELQPLVEDIVKQAVARELVLLRRQETDRLYSGD